MEVGISDAIPNMVPVNPNYIHYIDDPEESIGSSLFVTEEENNALTAGAAVSESIESAVESAADGASQIMAAKGQKTGRVLDWNYWFSKPAHDTSCSYIAGYSLYIWRSLLNILDT